ncbi:MAG: hypothetical protein ACI9C1_001129 [Candidatus Aldehydirespiratoraceae bacterium]|jgi:hypothetical protein
MQMLNLIAGLAWDPEIRGFMAVLTGIVVLMGSVWLILSTNSGPRLGTLISGAAFFGWMAIMGSVWWIYGIGYAGDRPVFEELEIVDARDGIHLDLAANDVAEQLQSEHLPVAFDLVVEAHEALIGEFGENVFARDGWEVGVPASDLGRVINIRTAWLDFGVVTVDDLTEDQKQGRSAVELTAFAAEEDAKNRVTTLSELAAVAPNLIPYESEFLGPWRLLSTAEMGEAQASATAEILASGDYDFGGQGEFRILNGYASGGKNGLPDNPSRWDRISQQVTSALTIKHPTGYAIIQLQAVTTDSLDNLPGQAPQRAVVDSDEPIVSVVMIRNLGNLRQVPAFITIGSLLIFLAFCYMLHERDKVSMARRAELDGAQ